LYLVKVEIENPKNTESKELYDGFRLFDNIQKHISLDASDKEYLKSVFSQRLVQRNELLLQQGEFCRKLFFVESGSLRAYNLTEEGKEATVMFAIEDWWVTDMHGFINHKPSLLSLEALENSKILMLDHKAFEQLLIRIPKFERFFRILFQNAYVREQLRVLDSISRSTEERYHRFRIKYPQIVERVTQKQIATYLGVTPEFLSSVKKK